MASTTRPCCGPWTASPAPRSEADRLPNFRSVAALTSVLSRPGTATDRNRRSGYADFLRGVGGRTTMFVRLSTVGDGLADADVVRAPSGPAINFCTEEVSYSLAGTTPRSSSSRPRPIS
ncbi:catalase [Streptomyces europaeiscabiei]|uniref:catalase n=1 Tax=Streptomyces europaeiscabiei TaxID=146819 RepID=UPI0039999A83